MFKFKAPEPIPAPGDYTLGKLKPSPWDLHPSTGAAEGIATSLYEYIGMVNYYWRLHYSKTGVIVRALSVYVVGISVYIDKNNLP